MSTTRCPTAGRRRLLSAPKISGKSCGATVLRIRPTRSGPLAFSCAAIRGAVRALKLCGGQIFIRVDEQCKVLCKIDALTANQAKAFKSKIEDDYRVLMYVLFAARLGSK